jgi:hypothetical protein
MYMRSILADTVSHRARFAGLAAAIAATLVAFVMTRPAPAEPDAPVWGIGHCIDSDGHVRAVRVDSVPAYDGTQYEARY